MRNVPQKRAWRALPGAEQAPDIATLQKMAPETMYAAMTNSPIPAHAVDLPDNIKRGFAEFVGGRKRQRRRSAQPMQNQCAANSGWRIPQRVRRGTAGASMRPAGGSACKGRGTHRSTGAHPQVEMGVRISSAASICGQPTIAAGRIFVPSVDTPAASIRSMRRPDACSGHFRRRPASVTRSTSAP